MCFILGPLPSARAGHWKVAGPRSPCCVSAKPRVTWRGFPTSSLTTNERTIIIFPRILPTSHLPSALLPMAEEGTGTTPVASPPESWILSLAYPLKVMAFHCPPFFVCLPAGFFKLYFVCIINERRKDTPNSGIFLYYIYKKNNKHSCKPHFFFTIKTLLENTEVLLVKSPEDARNLSKKSIRQRQKGTHEAHGSVTYKREMLQVS